MLPKHARRVETERETRAPAIGGRIASHRTTRVTPRRVTTEGGSEIPLNGPKLLNADSNEVTYLTFTLR